MIYNNQANIASNNKSLKIMDKKYKKWNIS